MPQSQDQSQRALVRDDQFRWLLAGNTAMFFGVFGTMLLRSLVAWEITGDEMALAHINLLSAICMFGASLVSGALIDRHERRRFLLLAQTLIIAAEGLILVLLVIGQLSFPFLLVSATASSIAFPFVMPARTAMLVETVGKPRLARATALMTAGINLGRMISPAAFGIAADLAGFVFCYSMILVLQGLSLFYTFRLRRYPVRSDQQGGLIGETLKGFRYVVQHPGIGLCILFGILPLLVVIPLQSLMVVFVDQVWEQGGSGLGIMMAATGIGGVVGSLGITLLREGSLVKPMVGGTLAMGAVLLFFAHLPYFSLAVLAVFAIYAASVLSQTLVHTAVQLMSEDYIRGRVTTLTMMSVSVAPAGTLLMAWSTKHFGAPWTMTAAGALLIIGVLLVWALVPAFRRIDEEARQASIQ
jgi:predicted MFS family arabinose efflux permease